MALTNAHREAQARHERIRQLRQAGVSPEAIRERLSVTKSQIRLAMARHCGLKVFKVYTADEIQTWKKRIKNGESRADIAASCGLTRNQVVGALWRRK